MQLSVLHIYRWKNERFCESALFNSCRKNNPQQLLPEEVAVAKKYMQAAIENDFSLIDGYYRRRWAAIMKNTFYKIGRALGMKATRYKKQEPKTGVRTSRPFQILHIDVTRIQHADETSVSILFITDNFSILGAKAALIWNAKTTVENIKAVCKHYSLYCRPLQLYCDNGSENQGALNGFLARHDVDIERVIAQIDVPFNNSMAEAANNRASYYHLFRRKFETLNQM